MLSFARNGYIFVQVGLDAENAENAEHRVLLKLLAKQVKEPKREPGTMMGQEYCARNNETPQMIADEISVNVKALVELNRVVYTGLQKHSKLQTGTIIMIPEE